MAVGFLGSLAILFKRRQTPVAPADEYVQVLNAQGELVEIPKSALGSPGSKTVRSKTALRSWLRQHGRQI